MHFLFFLLLSISQIYSMIAGYNYNDDDFIEYAKKQKESSSCCAVFQSSTGIQLSGVLIAPNIVVTAAHGAVHMGRSSYARTPIGLVCQTVKDAYVVFDNKDFYKVDKVYIDGRYITEDKAEYGKYDIAFLKLSKPVKNRPYINLKKQIEIPKKNTSFTVISHGMSDQNSIWNSITSLFHFGPHFLTRAFSLFEWSPFFVQAKSYGNVEFSRSLLFSSLFFDARKTYKQDLPIDADNLDQRRNEALYNWHANKRPPFALALPGTSGSPIFLIENDKNTLIGLVVAYAPINNQFSAVKGSAEHEHLLRHPKNAIDRYQTIFCTFYKEDVLRSTKDTCFFELDPIVDKIISLNNKIRS